MIDFINANNGNIEMFSNGNKIADAKTAKTISNCLIKNGYNGEVMASSSMDFATEEGFDSDDGALNLWNTGVMMFLAAEAFTH
tara:strand:- start:4010 stop:4258 length:249 start_codon:yes stop_codon:yes gene_type:complete